MNRDKDLFLTILVHDLKNPFNSLLGFSELLAKNIHIYEDNKISEYAETIYVMAKDTYFLLDDLLVWTRSQAGKIPFNLQRINFSQVCKEVLKRVRPIADKKAIYI